MGLVSEPIQPSELDDLVVRMAGVGVRRGTNDLLAGLDWTVELDERWVVLGPNGAGKTTLLRLAAAELHPTTGEVDLLGERIGRVNIFDLRPRIGFTSAAIAQRVPGEELVRDVVVSAGYAVLGRWREEYDTLDMARATELGGHRAVEQEPQHFAPRRAGERGEDVVVDRHQRGTAPKSDGSSRPTVWPSRSRNDVARPHGRTSGSATSTPAARSAATSASTSVVCSWKCRGPGSIPVTC